MSENERWVVEKAPSTVKVFMTGKRVNPVWWIRDTINHYPVGLFHTREMAEAILGILTAGEKRRPNDP